MLARSGGPDYAIADCGSTQSHELRLRAILKLPLCNGDSVQELGCGTGRLADLIPAGISYEGLDWSAEVVATAMTRRPTHRFRVGAEDDLTTADWIVASGPFNYTHGWSKERTIASMRKMWQASRRGIAVTVLRVPATDRLHYEPAELCGPLNDLDWSTCELDRSYLPNDLCLRAWRA
jgi:SAM-dependent methyltransferase